MSGRTIVMLKSRYPSPRMRELGVTPGFAEREEIEEAY
jgi:hypothetical protein